MSYRLINANALAENCRQVNDMPCIYADLPNGLDGNHYVLEQSESNRETRWYELFGTPERAVRTLEAMELDNVNWCNGGSGNYPVCKACPYEYDYYGCYLPDGFSLLEWLESEVDK